MRLIVGLGNPGRTYKYNRHNVGSLLIDRLAKIWGIKIKPDSATRCCVGKANIEGKQVILAHPLCFMNLVGNAMNLLLRKYDLNPAEDILVVCDDLDLEWGKVRIRPKGSSAGHKGVESIIRNLGNTDFARLRIGIGRPPHQLSLRKKGRDWCGLRSRQKKEIVDYVLSSWTRDEKKQLSKYLERAADCCKTWVMCGINKAMNKFNPPHQLG